MIEQIASKVPTFLRKTRLDNLSSPNMTKLMQRPHAGKRKCRDAAL